MPAPAHVVRQRRSFRPTFIRALLRGAHFAPLLVITLVVIAGNALYLFHVFNPNPVNTLSSLQISQTKGLTGGLYYIDPNIGFTAQALGHRAALNVLGLHNIWWNPYEGLGTPLAGEMNSAALFPPNLLLALSTGQLYFHMLLELTAGISTYFLCQRLKLSKVVSTVAGGAFALNGTFAWLFHSAGNPVAFLPMLLLGVELCLDPSRRWRGQVVIALSLALSLYAGFPESAFLDGLLVILWVLVRAIAARRNNWRDFVLRVGTGTVAGLLIAAPILVAFLDYLKHAQIGGHSGVFANYSEPGSSAPPFLIPYVYGSIFGYYGQNPGGPLTVFWDSAGGYFTPALCALAIVGTLGKRERALRLALAAWVLAGLARTFGISPFVGLFNLIPGVKTTAFFRYAPASWELSVILLAAFGLSDLIGGARRVKILAAAGIVLVAIGYAYNAAQPALKSAPGAADSRLSVACTVWGAVVLAAVSLVVILRSRRSEQFTIQRSLVLSGIVVIDVLAMFVIPQLAAPRRASLDYGPVNFLRAHLGTSRFFTIGPLSPDYGSYYGLASVNVNDLPTPTLYARYITKQLNHNASPITFTGVDELDFAGPSYEEEFLVHIDAYRNIAVKYLLAPAGAQVGPAPDGTVLPVVYSDPKVEILYLPGSVPYFEGSGCEFSDPSWNGVDVDCRQPTSVVRRELYMPGWGASINGHSLNVREVGNLFQEVSLPAGKGTLKFQFSPPHIRLAFAAFAVGVAFLFYPLLLRVWWRLDSRRRTSSRGESRAGEHAPSVSDAAVR